MRKLKEKPCSWCKKPYIRWNSTQTTCSVECALEKLKYKQERNLQRDIDKSKQAERREIKRRKEKLKSKSDWLREAQTACNAYIRERDKGLPCISCGNTRDVKYCAGHYKTRGGHPELRFHPFNINLQCDWNCNLNLSGNISNYRPALIEKIGLKNVEWLEGEHEPQNLTIDDIKEIKEYYREQLKILKSG
jgi:hypothetical protein